MKWSFRVVEARYGKALSKSRLPGLDYALNPYVGCSHACIYCYARLYTKNKAVSGNWGEIVVVKKDLIDSLKREVRRYPKGTVGLGTITDGYQPIEAVYKLSRRSLELLLPHGFHVSIQTKNPLILRDAGLLADYNKLVDVGFTITTLDEEVSAIIEPNAPPPSARVRALRALSEKGIPVWVFYGPIIPGLNSDHDTIRSLVELARELNAILYYDVLHVKEFMKTPSHPLYSLLSRVYREQYRIEETVLSECRRQGVKCKPGFSPG
ncbi:MAG: radical SAM protein [Desulfurococcus sp.]|nr:radical SAM protein [Desulfurococcus sp.]